MNLRIEELVKEAVAAGVLRPTSPMNGSGTDYVSVGSPDAIGSEDVFIGMIPAKQNYGEAARVYVSLRLAHRLGQEHETVDHQTVSDYWELSICGATTTARSRRQDDIETGGQNRETVAQVKGTEELVKAWEEHHLNGMTAGCDHQEVVLEDDRYGRKRPSLALTPACPITGYRYGHAWLVKELPADVVETVLAFFTARARKGN